MLDVQHGQHDDEQHCVDEHELEVGVVIEAEELVDRYPAVLGPAAELQAEEGGCRCRHAVRAAGERQPVVQHQADDLAEAQGHDRQVVAMHPQHREAEYAPRQRRCDGRQWQHAPEAQAKVLVTQRQAVRANGIERHVAQVEQAGQADHDVQPQAQQHVDQAEDDHGQQVLVGEDREDDGNHHQRRDDIAQPRYVVRRAHMHARATTFEALEHARAGGRLQVQAEQEAPQHHPADQPGHTPRLGIEGVAVEHHADDRAKHDECQQAGDDGLQQAAFDVETSGFSNGGSFGNGHVHTLATSGRPSRPCGRKIRIITSSEKLNTSL
ncbi:hypothetical protein D3C78_789550 [compost metagenome]